VARPSGAAASASDGAVFSVQFERCRRPDTATMAHRGRRDGRGEQRRPEIDIHELLKEAAFESPDAACDDHFEKSRPCPFSIHGASDQYIVLDSFSKLRESRTDIGQFRWNFMVQGETGDQVVGVKDVVDTVIAIQMAAFSMPIPPEVPYVLAAAPAVSPSGLNRLVLFKNNTNPDPLGPPTLVPTAGAYGQYPPSALLPPATTAVPWINNPYTQLPFGGRLTVQVVEAGLQSFSDRAGARHHFEFTASHLTALGLNPTMLQAVPVGGGLWDTYVFTDPLKDVHGVTLVFRNPDTPVRFLPDCLYEVSAAGDGAAAPGPFLRFAAPAHGLSAGDRVFVTGYNSGIGVLDVYVNRPEGHVVGGSPAAAPLPPGTPLAQAPGPGPFPDVFWLDPAVSLVDFAPPVPARPQIVTVCIAKRRLRIPVRIRRVVDRLTNYISP
jgi:hypothetical protein